MLGPGLHVARKDLPGGNSMPERQLAGNPFDRTPGCRPAQPAPNPLSLLVEQLVDRRPAVDPLVLEVFPEVLKPAGQVLAFVQVELGTQRPQGSIDRLRLGQRARQSYPKLGQVAGLGIEPGRPRVSATPHGIESISPAPDELPRHAAAGPGSADLDRDHPTTFPHRGQGMAGFMPGGYPDVRPVASRHR